MVLNKSKKFAEKVTGKALMEKTYDDAAAQKPTIGTKKAADHGATKESSVKGSAQQVEESQDGVTMVDVTHKEKIKSTVQKIMVMHLKTNSDIEDLWRAIDDGKQWNKSWEMERGKTEEMDRYEGYREEDNHRWSKERDPRGPRDYRGRTPSIDRYGGYTYDYENDLVFRAKPPTIEFPRFNGCMQLTGGSRTTPRRRS
ncbi:unnamed protein product [Linum trigynum]|uniref:Uncharacterized protein n=1 Tax=Linum trigynum TaxID=586398 RepID=A0AAV2FR73_9ROSI